VSTGASRNRLKFTTDMKAALSKADFVQGNAPEPPPPLDPHDLLLKQILPISIAA
jgi:hypothetical protein